MNEWISVKEAARIIGYSPAYFRELFCQAANPLVIMRQKQCPSGRRRILISRSSLESIIGAETVGPV